jgi:hypothetical protein
MGRLTPEREAEIRAFVEQHQAPRGAVELLAEIDALRSDLATAEQKGRELERVAIVAWLRLGEPGPSSRTYALCIERGVHVKP